MILARPAAAQDESEQELSLLFDVAQPVSAASKSATPEDASEAALHVVVIPGDEIRAAGYRTLAEVLAGVPEIFVGGERYWPIASIRGTGRQGDYNQRILVLLDGQVLNDAISDAVGIDSGLPVFATERIERVEVILGPVSSVYGSNAFHGAVNIVTRKPSGPTEGVQLEGGSFGHGRALAWYGNASPATFRRAPWSLQVYATGGRADGEPVAVEGAPWNREPRSTWYRNGAGWLSGSWGPVTLTAFTLGRRTGLLAGPYDDEGIRGRWYQRIRTTGSVEWRALRTGPFSVTVRAYANRTDTTGRSPYMVATDPGALFWYRVYSEEDGAEAVGEWRAGPSSLVVNVEDFYQRNSESDITDPRGDPGLTYTVGRAEIVDDILRGAAHERLRLGPVSLEAGAYAEKSRLHGEQLAPSAGAVIFPAPRTTLKALYGRGFRRPSFYEYTDAISIAGLVPETVNSFELQGRRVLGRGIAAEADAFHEEGHTVIGYDDPNFVYRNRGGSKSDGGTGVVELRGESGSFRVDASVLHARDDHGRKIVGSPSWLGHAAVFVHTAPTVDLSLRASAIGPRPDDSGEDLASSVLLDASVDQRLPHGLRANVSVTNLTGERFELPVRPSFYRAPLQDAPGRWVFLQLTWER